MDKEIAVLKKGEENVRATLNLWQWVIGTVLGVLALMLIVSWIEFRGSSSEN